MYKVPETITINGIAVPLKKQKGRSRGGFKRGRAVSEIPGVGRVFVVVYAGPKTRGAPKPRATPPVPRPSPPFVEDVQAQTLKVLRAMTTRLNALEAAQALSMPHARMRRTPEPSASA